ncbi:MAG: response regulator [Candidatus Nomurabacteria bacterium]|nr:response regulator [Candidatus Nomurabacteria bacterium]
MIDDDFLMAEVLGKIAGEEARTFSNGIEAMKALNDETPELIILDVLLVGPTGFSFLNELQSYDDTGKIPVILVSSVAGSMKNSDLAEYGVVAIFDKATLLPEELAAEVKKWTTKA